MSSLKLRLAGVELYFKNLVRARRFYQHTLGLRLKKETAGHHAQFEGGPAFICLERKGSESYPSEDKVVLFFEVLHLKECLRELGQHVVRADPQSKGSRPAWAVVHDPEGHNIVLLQRSNASKKAAASRVVKKPRRL